LHAQPEGIKCRVRRGLDRQRFSVRRVRDKHGLNRVAFCLEPFATPEKGFGPFDRWTRRGVHHAKCPPVESEFVGHSTVVAEPLVSSNGDNVGEKMSIRRVRQQLEVGDEDERVERFGQPFEVLGVSTKRRAVMVQDDFLMLLG